MMEITKKIPSKKRTLPVIEVCVLRAYFKKRRTKAVLKRPPCPAFYLIKRERDLFPHPLLIVKSYIKTLLLSSIVPVNNDAAVILRLIAAIACNRLARKQQGKRCSLAQCTINAYLGMVKLQKLVNDGHADA